MTIKKFIELLQRYSPDDEIVIHDVTDPQDPMELFVHEISKPDLNSAVFLTVTT